MRLLESFVSGCRRCGAVLLSAATMVAACADLTKVNAPDLVQRPALDNPTGAVTMFYGAVKSLSSGANLAVAAPPRAAWGWSRLS